MPSPSEMPLLASPPSSYAQTLAAPAPAAPRQAAPSKTRVLRALPASNSHLLCSIESADDIEASNKLPSTMRTGIEQAIRAEKKDPTWRCASVVRDGRNHRIIRISCRSEDNLGFPSRGPVDPAKLKHVRKTLSLRGCRRLDPSNHISAVISAEQLQATLRTSNLTKADLRPPAGSLPVELLFQLGFELPCLRGQHQVAAAKELLPLSNSWWVVSLYDKNSIRG
jgi:Protein of unknown function (DUF3723)